MTSRATGLVGSLERVFGLLVLPWEGLWQSCLSEPWRLLLEGMAPV